MRITFTQSGGFAGIVRGCTIDTERLPEQERAELESLVAASGLRGSTERLTAAGRDLPCYELLIEQGSGTARLRCDGRSIPAAARPLVGFLAARSGPTPPPRAWGGFEGDVVARWDAGGRDMTLTAAFAYVDSARRRWEAPAGAVVDGASIPRAFWPLIGSPFTGRYRRASVVHDVACVERLRPWAEVHRMFYEACRCDGVAVVQAKTMYYGVHHFGPRWHVETRRTVVAGAERTEQFVRDETPPQPSESRAREIAAYFAVHDVSSAEIPSLSIPPAP